MEEPAIIVKNVSKNFRLPHEKTSSIKNIFTHAYSYIRKRRTYETQHALRNISFEIKKGEFFGIVGRNGSGKSTMLKILAGIYQPSSGQIAVQGKLVPFIELGVGFSPELTGRENVYLNGALLGFSKKEIDDQYKDIVEFAELEKFMDQKLKNYSSGMQVRLAFSMAVRAKADVLLIDEVLAVGDADFQRKCFEYFKKLKKNSTTVVFVSHNMEAIREYCDRAMLVEKSRVIKIGDTLEVAQKYTRLFTEDKSNDINTKGLDAKRWGDESLIIDKISVDVTPETIIIEEQIRVNKTTDEPILGIRIRSSSGKEITGTNTKIEKLNLHEVEKGTSFSVEWQLTNILSDGTYYVDPAIVHSDGITVADWWDEAATFTVKKERHIPYMIDPGFKVLTKHTSK